MLMHILLMYVVDCIIVGCAVDRKQGRRLAGRMKEKEVCWLSIVPRYIKLFAVSYAHALLLVVLLTGNRGGALGCVWNLSIRI